MAFALAGALLAAAGCQTIHENHGYTPTEDELRQVRVGVHDRYDVEDAIGPPSSVGMRGGGDWYYISSAVEKYAYRQPKVVDRQVVRISFSGNGIVRNIERFGMEDGKVVALNRRITDPSVSGFSFMGQLFRNVGRIDAEDLRRN